MSYQVLLTQNKILAILTLANPPTQSSILNPLPLPLIMFHHHYPIVYFQQIHQHFQNGLTHNSQPGNIRFVYQGKQLPSELPIGLFVREVNVQLQIKVDMSTCLLDGFKTIKNSWKKAFQIINPNRKCDHVKSRLSKVELQEKYRLYKQGFSHGLQNQKLYQGLVMMAKGIFQDNVTERKYPISEFENVGAIVKDLFCLTQQQLQDPHIQILSFNLPVHYTMNSKIFLDQCNYNDGYCYFLLQCQQKQE